MSYLVLARKWRPRSFDTLVGQDHVVRALTHALSTQRLHHAWLFTGTRGVGKTTLSRILAKSLNCETGITATPCGVCRACTEIDSGRFVDYVELDAASNRGVDEMTQLLEQAVYAPGVGRFKVYMIDEVHMLTGHAFNAMLKTLEEPPPHVKFILATTDPQKIPVTVLSRCLQFNLKQMTPDAIVEHLQFVLGQEDIACEVPALQLLARAAAGSMRDALSLTDQAIAYSAGNLTLPAIQGMLGTIDQRYLVRLLEALLDADGQGVLAIADELADRGLSYQGALADLAGMLSRIAIVQRVPDAPTGDVQLAAALQGLAQRMHPDLVQLFYSVAVHSRGELALAPDEYAGFVMACLRMLAFVTPDAVAPAGSGAGSSGQGAATEAAAVATASTTAADNGHARQAQEVALPVQAGVRNDADAAPGYQTPDVPAGNAPLSVSEKTAKPAAPSAPAVRASASDPAAIVAAAAARAAARAPQPVEIAAPAPQTQAAPVADDVPPWEDLPAGERDSVADAPASRNAGAASTSPGAQAVKADDRPQADAASSEQAQASEAQGQASSQQTQSIEPPADDAPPAWLDDVPDDDNYAPMPDDESLANMAGAMSARLALEPDDAGAPAAAPRLEAMTPADWPALAAALPVTGWAAELARQSEWIGVQKNLVRLRVGILTPEHSAGRARLATVLAEHFGLPLRLDIEFGETGEDTAHAVAQAERAERQRQAEEAVQRDAVVQAFIETFDARIIAGSIRPEQPNSGRAGA